jgi:hypothetical protein
MKKEYNAPETIAVKLKTSSLLCASPDIYKGDDMSSGEADSHGTDADWDDEEY